MSRDVVVGNLFFGVAFRLWRSPHVYGQLCYRAINMQLCTVHFRDLRRTPCKTSLQTEVDEEDTVVQALPAPHNAYGERGYVHCYISHAIVISGD